MNEYILRRAIQDLFGHVDAIPASDAIVTALKRDGIDLDADAQANPRLAAQTAVALHPEHAPRPLSMSPAERLAIVERLASLDPRRAAAFRDETQATRPPSRWPRRLAIATGSPSTRGAGSWTARRGTRTSGSPS